MKRTLMILCAFAAAIVSAAAQEKEHALEITHGYPSLLFLSEFPWTNSRVEINEIGQDVGKEYYQAGINVGYTYSRKERWETSTLLNVHLTMYDIMQYPMVSPGDETHLPQYDFYAEPVLDHRSTSVFGSLSVSFRYKWLIREGFCMYSAIGAGVSISFPLLMPYLAPVGIKFGKGKVYGIVEANVSPATTFGMAGIGIRL